MNRKYLFLCIIAVITASSLFSQVSSDPSDKFYTDVLGWKLRNIVTEVPVTKPYTLPVIKKILLQVQDKGTAEDKKDADEYFRFIFGQPVHGEAEVKGCFAANIKDKNPYEYKGSLTAGFDMYGDFLAGNYFSAGYNAGADVVFFDLSPEDFLSLYSRYGYEYVGNAIAAGSSLINIRGSAAVSYTGEHISAALSYGRTGFGPFVSDDPVLSIYAPSVPSCTVSYNGKYIDFTQHIALLQPFGKLMMMHAVRFPELRKMRVTCYDSVVYSGRFDPSYLIPVPGVLIEKSNGYNDNVQTGFLIEYSVFPCVDWVSDLLIDDLDIPALAHLDFSTDDRIALRTGFQYSPLDSICSLVTFDYTMVTPFTYQNGSSPSDCAYTTGDTVLGVLPSNSDRVKLEITMTPLDEISVTTKASFIRHGNENESAVSGNEARLLNQNNLMYICEGGFEAVYMFKNLSAGTLRLAASYMFEYIHNDGVDSEVTAANYETWKSSLCDSYRNYLTASVKYTY